MVTTATVATAAREAFAGRVGPALDALEMNMRQMRRAVMRGKHTAEDMAVGASLMVRRHPLTSVTTAMCAGLAVGALAGYVLGRNGRRGA